MKFIGITGGVGAGKSFVLSCLQEECNCRIILADDVGNEVKMPGQPCFERIVNLLGPEVLTADGQIDRQKMAAMIFSDEQLLKEVNEIIHPAVYEYIMKEAEKERAAGEKDYFFLEAALLIEAGYEAVLDEMWYIHADQDIRRARLKESRGYSDEKIDSILASQLSEDVFRERCSVVIENNGKEEETRAQIRRTLGLYPSDRSND